MWNIATSRDHVNKPIHLHMHHEISPHTTHKVNEQRIKRVLEGLRRS